MENSLISATNCNEDGIFMVQIIEEDSVCEDMLCNTLGCA